MLMFYLLFSQVLLSKDCQIVSTLGLVCDNLSDRIQLAQSVLKIFKHDKREAILLKTLTSVEVANEGMYCITMLLSRVGLGSVVWGLLDFGFRDLF